MGSHGGFRRGEKVSNSLDILQTILGEASRSTEDSFAGLVL